MKPYVGTKLLFGSSSQGVLTLIKIAIASALYSFYSLFFSPLVFAQQALSLDTLWQNRPDFLSLEAEQQSRMQFLDGQFRAGLDGSDQAMEVRTIVKATMDFDKFTVVSEFADMRAIFADQGTPLDNTIVDPLDILQLNLRFPLSNIFGGDNEGFVQIGRFTLDQGNRRWVARNRFRNTINAFAGVLASLEEGNSRYQFFYTLPTNRRNDGNPLDNKPLPDNETGYGHFWGLFYNTILSTERDQLELYLYGLNENRHALEPELRNRLLSPGVRLFRSPATSRWHYEGEFMLQRGKAPARQGSTLGQAQRAHFVHLEAGYSFAAPWQPSLSLIYDYASGDSNPLDNENNSFDSLYGVPRTEYGPTGIYRAFVRNNINTPGLLLTLQASDNIDAFIKIQDYSLAAEQQGWRTTRYQHPGGLGETRVGTQLETRLRWHVLPSNLTLEAGVTWLRAGPYMDRIGKDNSRYVYFQTILRL